MTEALLGTWGRPPDALAKLALGTAIALVILAISGRGRTLLSGEEIPRRHFLAFTAFIASLLSLFWIATYLRGGPRIVDATTYFLQGRALSQGELAWALPQDLPSASFRGRFLLHHDGELGGIFPPGYPLLLAIGFSVGAPMIIGPLLAGGIVVATYFLAHAIAEEVVDPSLVEPVARGAALLSITSAALRYHTADTMSHGATALGITVALTLALRRRAGLAGLAVGYVVATRPVSAVPIAIVSAALLARTERKHLLRLALGMLPGVFLLLLSQKSVTGSWLVSTQRAYYAASDGPPNCFRWGFGDGVGCLGEHGEFVQARLAKGYGVVAALGTTLRRLRMHLTDVANLEPLALLVLVPIASSRGRRARPIVSAAAVILLHVLGYAPFYFDGNYPGGGARFFADVLPIEHALVVVGLALLARASDRVHRRALFGVLGLALAGFAVHAAYDHVKLAERDGGRPMYEPDLLLRANALEGLVYVDSDHGFALGHVPGAKPNDAIVVVRLRGDDRDRIVFDRLDRPPTWLYRRDENGSGPVLQPWAPPDTSRPFRFEAEAEWPPLHQEGGLVVPVQVDACASNSRALAVAPIPKDGTARATIAVPVPETGLYRVVVRVVRGAVVPHTEGVIDPKIRGVGVARLNDVRWDWLDEAAGCSDLADKEIELVSPAATLEIEAIGGLVAVDRVTLMPRNR
jgi:hypothetical protein